MLSRFAAFSAVLACVVPSPVRAQAPTPIEYRRAALAADSAFEAGDFGRAIRAYAELDRWQPRNPETLRQLAVAQLQTGARPDAIETLERLVAAGHTLGPQVTFLLATLHAREGHREASLDWLERTLAEGFEDRSRIADDEAFAAWRDDPRFQRLAGLPPGDLGRDAGWRFDVAFFAEEARRLHADPARPAHAPEFQEAVDRLRANIPSLSDDEILTELMSLAALLGDGHSVIYGPGENSPGSFEQRTLPVLFYEFSDGLYIVDATDDLRHLVGARVTRIGSLTPGEALERLTRYRGVDNAMTVHWLGVHFYLPRLAMLKAIGALEEVGRVELTLEMPEGESERITLHGGTHEFRRKLRPQPGRDRDPPRYLRHVDTNYWLESLPDLGAVYVQFNQVRNAEEGPSLAEFADSLADTLARGSARNLIVDVRHNNGGNNGLLRPLLRALIAFEMADPGHRLYVITGRNTFSAAQNFVNRVERLTDAVFVGEPSSSSPNFVGEEIELVLPWSKVRGSISSRFWQDSDPGDRRPWIAPDIPVTLSSSDYFSGRDPVMETFEALLRS